MTETVYKAPERDDDPDFEDTIAVGDADLIMLAGWTDGDIILSFGSTEVQGELALTADEAARLAKSLLDATQVAGCKHFKV